jgi:hypothetical protein
MVSAAKLLTALARGFYSNLMMITPYRLMNQTALVLSFFASAAMASENDDLRAELRRLHDRVSQIENTLTRNWSCAALCGSVSNFHYVYGRGAEGATAFQEMDHNCQGPYLFINYERGKYNPATLANACSANSIRSP